ncbi:PREDICTED: uncharacterized protein LOC104587121 isoform X3 [Nelumbo nucifera]|uniref:Uncharacterized protein LOC104587121 isoform X3 n=1 Tax=Nelumbo nucifera TaxID=4432 RepID=A0A1U7YXU1_NELNU|nr:PREDICTED: uncharacterized protein LOC104587121 isoform X3 [Nelumbo nucifera]
MMKNPAPSSIAVAPPFYSNGRSGVELALEELAKNKKTLVPLEGGAKAAYSSSFLFLFFLSFEAQLLSLSLCQSLNLSDRVQCSKKSCRICPSLIFWMVKQAIDSKANENGLGNVGPGFHTCDKQHPVPAKKTALRDLQNSYRTVVPKTQVPLSLGKTGNGLLLRESENPIVTSGDSLMVNQRAPSESHWKERFLRLQTFLRNCDHSSQEEYIQMLRSLPPVGRSRHAVELEKRAIHLSLEEGKEVHRVTVLNVLGKSVTKSNALLSPQQPN